MFQKRTVRWSIAAAVAAAVILMIGFWPGTAGRGSGNGIVWADVVKRMDRAETAIWFSTLGSSLQCRFSWKTGLGIREDQWENVTSRPSEGREPDSITLHPAEGSDRLLVTWQPAQKLAFRKHLRSTLPEEHPDVSEYLAAIRRLGADTTRRVGEDKVNGVPTVVFESSLADLMKPYKRPDRNRRWDQFDAKGTIRVYVPKQTLLPIRWEIRLFWPTTPESVGLFEVSDIQWDVPLSNHLFDVPTFDKGWTITDERECGFSKCFFSEKTTFSLRSENGPAIISEADIDCVTYGTEEASNRPGEPLKRHVVYTITDQANDRLNSFSRAHRGSRVVNVLNGREVSREEIRVSSNVPVVQMDITSLGITPEEFERRYLSGQSGTRRK